MITHITGVNWFILWYLYCNWGSRGNLVGLSLDSHLPVSIWVLLDKCACVRVVGSGLEGVGRSLVNTGDTETRLICVGGVRGRGGAGLALLQDGVDEGCGRKGRVC